MMVLARRAHVTSQLKAMAAPWIWQIVWQSILHSQKFNLKLVFILIEKRDWIMYVYMYTACREKLGETQLGWNANNTETQTTLW
jgi:hypothetical protein